MSKRFVRWVLACSLISSSLSCEEEQDPFPKGKPVGKASEESVRAASRTRWQNWAIAGAVVTVGIVTLVLVARNR